MALPLDHCYLMHEEHRVAGLQLHTLLGHGARSAVYEVEPDAAEGGIEGEDKCADEYCCLPDRAFCKVYKNPPEGVGRGEAWQGFERERAALLRLQDVPNIPKIYKETTTPPPVYYTSRKYTTERVLVLSPVGVPLWPVRDNVVVTGRHFAQLVSTVEAMHSAGVLHRDIKPANVFLQEDTDLLLLADFDAAVLQKEVEVAYPPQSMQPKVLTRSAKVKAAASEGHTLEGPLTLETLTFETTTPTSTPKAWRQDQQFMWVGSAGYSDTRPIAHDPDSCLHTPTPEHDLVALVRTVHSLYTNTCPSGSRHDGNSMDIDAFWEARMPATSMWQDFLQLARSKDYAALRLALGRL